MAVGLDMLSEELLNSEMKTSTWARPVMVTAPGLTCHSQVLPLESMETNRWRWALTATRKTLGGQWFVGALTGITAPAVAAGAIVWFSWDDESVSSAEFGVAALAGVVASLLVGSIIYFKHWWTAPKRIRETYDARISELEAYITHDYEVVLESVNPRGTFSSYTDWSVDIRLRNRGAAGTFTVRVMDFEGQNATPGNTMEAPWFIRWRKPNVTEYPLKSEDAEILYLAEIFPGGKNIRFFASQHDVNSDEDGYDAILMLPWCRLRLVVWVDALDEPIEEQWVTITSHDAGPPVVVLEPV